jgi:adenylate cyclase
MTARLRTIAGVVLFAYVTTHLLNHALGLISLAAMEAGREMFLAVWRNPIGSLALYGSLAGHAGLSLWALYRRRDFRLSTGEFVRILLGLAVIPLLAGHFVGTRGAHQEYGVSDSYTYVLLVHWRADRSNIVIQTAALASAWIHGCIGLHLWLRFKPWYRRALPVLYGLAIVVPVCAYLGYVVAGRG